jgi:hypothetical protein
LKWIQQIIARHAFDKRAQPARVPYISWKISNTNMMRFVLKCDHVCGTKSYVFDLSRRTTGGPAERCRLAYFTRVRLRRLPPRVREFELRYRSMLVLGHLRKGAQIYVPFRVAGRFCAGRFPESRIYRPLNLVSTVAARHSAARSRDGSFGLAGTAAGETLSTSHSVLRREICRRGRTAAFTQTAANQNQ